MPGFPGALMSPRARSVEQHGITGHCRNTRGPCASDAPGVMAAPIVLYATSCGATVKVKSDINRIKNLLDAKRVQYEEVRLSATGLRPLNPCCSVALLVLRGRT